MTRILAGLFLASTLGGCVIVEKKPGHARREHRSCKPSQHWEDGRCVHNGRGKGARKHDDNDDQGEDED